MIIESPLDLIFRDLFFRARGFAGGRDLFLKLEGFNITGSIKIKTATGLVGDCERRGLAHPGKTVFVESSSGNLGAALALVCAVRGYRFICVTDPNIAAANLQAMRVYGAEVRIVATRDANGGYLGSRLAAIQAILDADDNAVWLNQYANPANKEAHARETALEIAAQFPVIDWLFVGTGTTGTCGGLAESLRKLRPNVRIIAVEPEGSVTFGGAPGRRAIPGIGASIRPPLADDCQPDEIVYISERDAIRACQSFARSHHLLVGGSTGSVLAAVRVVAHRFVDGDTIVAVSPDPGEKYLDTIYDGAWENKIMRSRNAGEREAVTEQTG